MESNLADYTLEDEDTHYLLTIPDVLDFKPFIKLGDYNFGMSAQDFSRVFNVSLKENANKNLYFNN